ncbi:MAG: hypothetical protein QOJ76_916 [Acidobacteriota bacterium]|nr:hypothetical protein [Acidobacteriota bacterium]
MTNKLSPFTIFYRARREEDDSFDTRRNDEFNLPGIEYRRTGGDPPAPPASARAAAKSRSAAKPSKGGTKKSSTKKLSSKKSSKDAGSKKASKGSKKASKGGSGKRPSKSAATAASASSARRRGGAAPAPAGGARLPSHLEFIGATAPELAAPLASLNPNLAHTLLDSSLAQVESGENWAGAAVERLRPVVEDLRRGSSTVTVAVWDLDARVGLLPNIIETLNGSQDVFTFFDLQAPMPAGLVIRTEHFDDWVKHRTKQRVNNFTAWVRDSSEKKRVSEKERREFKDNLMSNDFYRYARVIHKQLGVNYLAGVTQYKVAGHENGDYFWDYFSASQKGVLLASAFDLREYAHEAGRPFEVAVAQVVLAQLIVEMSPKVRFHEDRGCIFDFNDNRVSIIRSIRETRIEPECLAKIAERYRGPVESMVAALRNYSRPAEFQQAAQAEQRKQAEQKKSAKHDDTYWLKQLNLLSTKLSKDQKR